MKQDSFPWRDKIINNAQVGGIETSVLDNGSGRGVRIAWVNTGGGLRYKVVIDRAMDIMDAFYNENSIAFLSHAGVTAPRPDANTGLEWLYSFGGGLLTTCGLSHIGGPEKDEYGQRGLHGRISNTPAEIVSVVQPDVIGGKLDMSITGVVRETKMFGPSLEMRRTISSKIGQAVLRISDEVRNCGNEPVPHMILYHINFGWPLVDEGTEILWRGRCTSFGRDMDDEIFKGRRNYCKCPAPMKAHRGSGEACAYIDVKADRNGLCTVGLNNKKLNLAVQIKYRKKQLPYLTNWQHWGLGDYVTALEPGTNPPMGQMRARERRELIFLKPGQSKKYEVEISVLSRKEDIGQFARKTGVR